MGLEIGLYLDRSVFPNRYILLSNDLITACGANAAAYNTRLPRDPSRGNVLSSSSGLGHRPLTAGTGVRAP